MMAADSHTTRRKHQRQPNTQRPVWGPDPPHGHCTHAQPPPPTNRARAQESKAGPGGTDSAPPMGGRPCPSASEVTRTQPPREERPCPGSRGRRASWRQRSAQRGGSIAHNAGSTAGQSRQRHTMKLASTQQHAAAHKYNRAKQSSVPQQQRRTATPPAASTNTSQTPNTQGGSQTHYTGTSPTHSHRRPQTRHAHGAPPRPHTPTPTRRPPHTQQPRPHLHTT